MSQLRVHAKFVKEIRGRIVCGWRWRDQISHTLCLELHSSWMSLLSHIFEEHHDKVNKLKIVSMKQRYEVRILNLNKDNLPLRQWRLKAFLVGRYV